MHKRASTLVFFFCLILVLGGFTFNNSNEPASLPATHEFRAEKTKAKDIDDTINKLAPEGWMPAFILDDELRKRVLFRRSLNPDRVVTTLEYSARTVDGMMKQMQDVVNEEAAEGWMPVFIVRDVFKHRIIFTRDTARPNAEAEYMKLIVDESRHLDDAFNHHGAMGWEAKFVIEYGERYHVLFRRKKGVEQQPKRYRAIKTFGTSLIDNTYEDMAASGWQPIMTFQDKDDYRMLFVEHPNAHRLEYFAERVTKIKHVDDSFNRRNQNGWYPIFVFQFEADKTLFTEEEQFRLLFTRVKA